MHWESCWLRSVGHMFCSCNGRASEVACGDFWVMFKNYNIIVLLEMEIVIVPKQLSGEDMTLF